MGGIQRNLGLVAGCYAVRNDSIEPTQLNPHMIGINLTFTPEPNTTAALMSGLTLNGLVAQR
jgi:hypothetical protein